MTRVAIVQVGLLHTWLHETLVQDVIRANANCMFFFLGDFHNHTAATRYRRSKWEAPSPDLARVVHTLSALPNCDVINVTVRTSLPTIHRTPEWPTQYTPRTRVIAATTLIRMRDMVAQTTSYAYTICIREDALWYHPLQLQLVDMRRDDRLHLKACMNYGGLNNKALLGHPARLHGALSRLCSSFWKLPSSRPPYNLEGLFKQTLARHGIPYIQPRAKFDTRGRMESFGITLADGVRTASEFCYRGRYWGGDTGAQSHLGGCGEEMRTRANFSVC